MNLPKIVTSGVYKFAQRAAYTNHYDSISLSISGLIWSRAYDPAGNLINEIKEEDHPGPHLRICTPGTRSEFEYGKNRENWVIQTHFDGLEYDPGSRTCLLNYDGIRIPIPRCITLAETEVIALRNRFRTVTEYFNSALPQNVLAAEIMTLNLFRRFLENTDIAGDDPVEQFRKNLDQDETWSKTLDDHCRELGVCRDSMRHAFFQRYKIAPGDYRIRRRLQKILHLFAHTQLTLKEVAFAVGMKNVTHLNSLLKAHYGKTPSQLCREYRFTGLSGHTD